jgi:hypothetical protein
MQGLAKIIQEFDLNPTFAARQVRELAYADPAVFLEMAVPLLRSGEESKLAEYLLSFVIGNRLIGKIACDPNLFSVEEARALAERARKVDPSFDVNLYRELFGPDGESGIVQSNIAIGIRFIDILDPENGSAMVLSLAGRLMRHPNERIRAKATGLITKLNQHPSWVEQMRYDQNPRVRANALEALEKVCPPEQLQPWFWTCARDTNNRVAGNALIGLYRLGDKNCIPLIVEMASDEREKFRATAAWIMGESGDPQFLDTLKPLLTDTSLLVRRNAKKAEAKIRSHQQSEAAS